jgi:hypothetical protein
MSLPVFLKIIRVTIDPVIETPLIAPINTNTFWITGDDPGNSIYYGSDAGIASSRVRIFPPSQLVVNPPRRHFEDAWTRYLQGDTLGYLLSSAGTGPAVVFCFY